MHIYMNPPRRNQPGRFSGDAMLELKSLDALVEVLKMDGEVCDILLLLLGCSSDSE